jgi:CNT family concentrative nucleoside transporter
MPFQGVLGLIALVAFAWGVSENRRRIKIHTILIGLIVQFALALIMLKIPASREIFTVLNYGVEALDKATPPGLPLFSDISGGSAL